MSNHVYRAFTKDDLFHTTVHAQPSIVVESGSAGWTGNTNLSSNALSLYGGVRARPDVFSGSTSGLQVYPIDFVDTESIDKVIGVPGQYPQTGSINLVYMTDDEQPSANAVTDTRWYEEHFAPIEILSDWYHSHRYNHYPPLGFLPSVLTVIHVPELFYGRQIATGSVLLWTQAWKSLGGSNALITNNWENPYGVASPIVDSTYSPFGSGAFGSGFFAGAMSSAALSGTRYYADDGRGRLFDVPATIDELGNVQTNWRDALLSGTAYRVGSVFYNEGLILFTHPNPLWHQQFFSASFDDGSQPTLHVQFSGSTVMKSMVFMCRMPPVDVNCSNNPTFFTTDVTGKRFSVFPQEQSKTYITAVGIYNEERQLVAVAKLAQPIRKRETDNVDIRLKFDI